MDYHSNFHVAAPFYPGAAAYGLAAPVAAAPVAIGSPGVSQLYTLEFSIHRVSNLVGVPASCRLAVAFSFGKFPTQLVYPHPSLSGAQPTSNTSSDPHRTVQYDCVSSQTFASGKSCAFAMAAEDWAALGPTPTVRCQLVDAAAAAPTPIAAAALPVDVSALTGRPGSSGGGAAGSENGFRLLTAGGVHVGLLFGSARIVPSGGNNTPTAAVGAGAALRAGRPRRAAPYVVKVTVDGAGSGGNDHRSSSGGRSAAVADSKRASTARRKTLLFAMQYDVLYQLRSDAATLHGTLRREHERLDTVGAPSTHPALLRLGSTVQRIVRLTNIAVQLCVQIAGGGSGSASEGSVPDPALLQPNALPAPKDGSVSHFLTYEVLYQLQALAAAVQGAVAGGAGGPFGAAAATSPSASVSASAAVRARLEVPLSSLHRQHARFVRRLAAEVATLTRGINIVVQATVDGHIGTRAALEEAAKDDYSSDGGSSSSSSSSSSDGSISDGDDKPFSSGKGAGKAPAAQAKPSSPAANARPGVVAHAAPPPPPVAVAPAVSPQRVLPVALPVAAPVVAAPIAAAPIAAAPIAAAPVAVAAEQPVTAPVASS